MTDPTRPRALDVLGDALEEAAGRAVVHGGVAPGRGRWNQVLLVPAIGLFILVGALAVALAGSGSVDDDPEQVAPEPRAVVVAAARETADLSTGRFELTMSVSETLGGADVELRISGAYDLDADRFSTSLDLGALTGGFGGDLPGVGDLSFEMVVDGDTVYLHLGPLGPMMGLGGEWVAVTVPGGGLGGLDGFGIDQAGIDPSGLIGYLEGLGGDATEVGAEDVRGVPTTHYRGEIDVAALLDGLADDDAAGVRDELSALLPDVDVPRIPVDVWVDADGLVRKVSLRVDMAGLGGAAVTAEYYDIGAAVDITVPAADELVELPDVGLGEIDFGGMAWPELDLSDLPDLEALFAGE